MKTSSAAKKVAILQSNYIPWKGYFDLINMVDEFILYDEAQYTKRDWRNRNIIKTPQGLHWLTIPVLVRGKFLQRIIDTKVSDHDWGPSHWAAITHNYAKAPWFRQYRPIFEPLYTDRREEKLSLINFRFIEKICGILGIRTNISWSHDYPSTGNKTERLVEICTKAAATHYISGPSAKAYIRPELFHDAGIDLSFIDYGGYPAYPQSTGTFEHRVTILDLIFNMGPDATKYMLSFK